MWPPSPASRVAAAIAVRRLAPPLTLEPRRPWAGGGGQARACPWSDATRRGLGRFGLVDPHRPRRSFHQWRAAVAAGLGLVVRVEQRLPVSRGHHPAAVMNAVRGE